MRVAPSFTLTSLFLIVMTLAVARGGEGGGDEAGGEVGADIDGYDEYDDEYDYEEMPRDNMYDNEEGNEMPITVKFVNEFPDKVSPRFLANTTIFTI
jgi:hypothetical protein